MPALLLAGRPAGVDTGPQRTSGWGQAARTGLHQGLAWPASHRPSLNGVRSWGWYGGFPRLCPLPSRTLFFRQREGRTAPPSSFLLLGLPPLLAVLMWWPGECPHRPRTGIPEAAGASLKHSEGNPSSEAPSPGPQAAGRGGGRRWGVKGR